MQALGYAAIFAGALVLIAGITGSTIPSVAKGMPDRAQAVAVGETPRETPGEGAAGVTGSTAGPHGTIGAQKQFGDAFARLTGLDRGVVEKWLLAEQPPGSPSKPGSNNWLNVQYTDSGPNATYFAIAKLSPAAAAAATVAWIKQQSGLRGILASAHSAPAAQEAAIINSGWASSHYGGHL